MGILGGICSVASKVAQWIPGRIESLKNEKERLLDERNKIMLAKYSTSDGRRVDFINKRLYVIEKQISNNAKD